MPVKRPRARAEVASAVAGAATVRRRGTVPIIPADADAACGALAERVVERAARVVVPGFMPRRRERAKTGVPPRDRIAFANVMRDPPANVSRDVRAHPLPDPHDMSGSNVAAHERDRSAAAQMLATAWGSRIEPGDVTFERVVPSMNDHAEIRPRSSPPPAGASAPEARASAGAYPPRDLLAPTARRNVAAETDSSRIDPPVVDAPSAPLTPLRARRGFPFPAAGPLSISESVAEERPAFDSVVFAEQVRASLVHDARRHGIDV